MIDENGNPTREHIKELWKNLTAAMNELEQFINVNLQHNRAYDPNSDDRIEWDSELQRWQNNVDA